MWSSSGYGQQMFELLPMIKDAGYPTAIVNFYGLDGGQIVLDGITCYPKVQGQWGDDAVVNFQKIFNADIVITLQDIWVLNDQLVKQFKNWTPIVPIDHEPTPPAIKDKLKHAYRIITYSKFGHKQLEKEGMHSTYIPHTVDTRLFKKVDKIEIRKRMNLPQDAFIFGMVAANKDNPPRKSFQQVLDAFHKFVQVHPKSAIYFHTAMDQPKGFPIKQYAKFLGIENKIFHCETFEYLYLIDRDQMNKIYSSFDCLLMPSTNEGFGVPAIEAQSCETPVIVNDFTAMPELVAKGKTGFVCEVDWKRFSPLLSYVGIPSTDSLYQQMEKMFSADRVKMGKAGRRRVQRNYDTRKVFKEKWLPFLRKLSLEIHGKE